VLRQRLLTALILIPLVVAGVLGLATGPLAGVFAAIILLAGWEWAALAGLSATPLRVAYLALLGLLLLAVAPLAIPASAALWLLGPVLGGWLLAAAWVLTYQRTAGTRPSAPGPWALRLIGVAVLVPPWLALVALHGSGAHGPWLVLFLLVLIWTADSGAYFAGRRWGRRKLATQVSPGKSLEGVAGALLLGGLFALAAGAGLGYAGPALAGFVLLGLVTVAVSVLGDLFESLVKRYGAVKDSGGLLPGHGGVLDRIDSLTAAAPLFAVGLAWLGGAR
jgi:phosphatidate cytidylyltransferase